MHDMKTFDIFISGKFIGTMTAKDETDAVSIMEATRKETAKYHHTTNNGTITAKERA